MVVDPHCDWPEFVFSWGSTVFFFFIFFPPSLVLYPSEYSSLKSLKPSQIKDKTYRDGPIRLTKMPPRITLNINRLASSRLVARGSAQSFTAVNTDAATTGAGIDITRRFSALCVRDTTNCNAINSSALRRSCPQHQQRRMQSTSDGKSDDPAVRKIEEDVEKTPEDKLAGHNIPHPKLKKSLSPEEEQGSPVEEVCFGDDVRCELFIGVTDAYKLQFFKRDKNALKYAPKVVQDKLNPKPPAGSRSYSTAVDSAAGGNGIDAPLPGATPMEQLIAVMENKPEAPIEGLKFDMPPKPDYATGHFRKRYDPVLDQFTKMLMRDGKLARAENVSIHRLFTPFLLTVKNRKGQKQTSSNRASQTMNAIIDILRRSPPPKVVPERPLVYSLPAEEYPLNPVLYLTNVVDSIAPLLRLKQMKGAAGGGMSLPVPRPLNSRQRRRTAIKWIIEASEKRRDIALPKRIADEIVAVAEGRSSVWQKRDMVHKSGISARTNMSLGPRR